MAKDFSNNAAFEMLNTPASEGKKKATVKTATTAKTLSLQKRKQEQKLLLLLKLLYTKD